MSGDYLHPTEVERDVTKAFEAIRGSDAEYEAPLVQKCLQMFASAQAETQRLMEIWETRQSLDYNKRLHGETERAITAKTARLAELGPP